MGAPDPADPFAIFTQPPPNETPEQRQARVAREAEEKRVSDRIDDQIKQDRAAMKKKDKNTVKVLLLGQSESGKSTTLKNFRLKYAKAAWKAERQSWKSVVQLNLIRSILTILDTLQSEADGDPLPPFPTSSLQLQAYPYNFAQNPATRTSHQSRPSTDTQDSAVTIEKPEEVLESRQRIQLAEKHQVLRRRLGPLRRVEQDLKRRLGAGTDEVFFNGTTTGVLGSSGVLEESTNRLTESPKEFGVRGWKAAFSSSTAGSSSGQADNGSDEASDIIAQCREDMIALWEDQTVKQVLKKRRMRIEDAAGFYLNDLDRIATRGYEPSDDDIIRARLRTLGVQEHRIQFDQSVQNTAPGILGNMGLGPDFGHEWILYDVGGSRTSRHAWLPYFEGVNAIIFLAPISCFDERLLEDPSVNRLEDSFILWSAVCANKLLAKSTIILFLNKCDILKKKLKAGIQVKNFLPSYGERPNEASAVLKYLKDKFKDLSRTKSPEPRVSYFYATSVTDTRATATTLKTVRDSILREHLKNADLV